MLHIPRSITYQHSTSQQYTINNQTRNKSQSLQKNNPQQWVLKRYNT